MAWLFMNIYLEMIPPSWWQLASARTIQSDAVWLIKCQSIAHALRGIADARDRQFSKWTHVWSINRNWIDQNGMPKARARAHTKWNAINVGSLDLRCMFLDTLFDCILNYEIIIIIILIHSFVVVFHIEIMGVQSVG